MVIHKRNNLKGETPLCWPEPKLDEAFMSHPDVDVVDCMACLRMLAKSAVVYGNGRRANRTDRR